jgi:hypothetical protein
VFDIGEVLEITPDLGVTGIWESRLGLALGKLRSYQVGGITGMVLADYTGGTERV